MKTAYLWIALAAAISGQPKPQFEVASIRLSAIGTSGDISRPGPVRSTIEYTADGLRVSRYTVRALLAEAYQVPQSRVKESDESQKKVIDRPYDIAAKSERSSSKDELRLMLKALLQDRFQLSLHIESKQEDVYRLVARKGGLKVEKSTAVTENAHWERGSDGVVRYRDATAAKFGEILRSYFERPVLASTDFEGLYNFPLSPNASATEEGRDAIIDYLQRFGVGLVKDKAKLDYLVVDSVAPPTEN